jgi:peptidoglycan/LPS O-acetylase OafA/YrhL
MPPPLRDDKRTFVTLDGLRGVAAFAILARHTLSRDLLFESYLAVDFFFVLSGFVLAHAYGKRLRGEMSPAAFMKVRLIRLYPLYALALALSTVPILTQYLHGNPPLPGIAIDYAAAILFLPTPASPSLFPLVGPSWSLFFELIANGVLGLFWRSCGSRMLVAVVFASALVLIIAATTKMFGFGYEPGAGALNNGYYWKTFGAGLIRVAFSFFCGVLVYQIWLVRKPPFSAPPLVIAASLLGLLAVHPLDDLQVAYDLTVTILIFPLVLWLAASSQVNGVLGRAFALLGLTSYGVYILHFPLFPVKSVLQKLIPSTSAMWPINVGFIVFVFAFALAADYYFDRPVRQKLMMWVRCRHP